jgi:hypothetical protein
MDSTSHKTPDDIINESDGSGSGSTISDSTGGVSNGKDEGQKLMVPLGEKNKEANKEDNKVFEFPFILNNELMTTW